MRIFAALALLLATTACTQPAALVEYKGHENFGKDKFIQLAALDYAELKPGAGVPTTTTPTMAPAASIGVADLAPPVKPVAEVKPVVAASAPAIKETPKTIAAAPVNPWTRTPRTEKEPAPEPKLAEVKPAKPLAAPAPVASPAKSVQNLAKPMKTASSDFIWPVESKKVVSTFGPKGAGIANDGINIASQVGDRVWASADGEVIYVGNELKGYGNMAIVKHNGGKTTTYAYMSRIAVDKYARVKQGDTIGYVGHTGNAKQPQLHFALRNGNAPVDPMKYLKRTLASAE